MALGRIFPIRNPNRSFPYDPMEHGETNRNAPLPFQLGAGSSYAIETIFEIQQIMQTYAFIVTDPTVPTGGGGGAACTPSNNQMCVPTATITLAAAAVAEVTCTN
jgi:hypothetical protein